jgi:hypothetical protein
MLACGLSLLAGCDPVGACVESLDKNRSEPDACVAKERSYCTDESYTHKGTWHAFSQGGDDKASKLKATCSSLGYERRNSDFYMSGRP